MTNNHGDQAQEPEMVRATAANFFEQGYIAANKDVAAIVQNRSGDGLAHFLKYGKDEVRLQYTETGLATLRKVKFDYFSDILTLDNSRFQTAEGSFPVIFTERHYSLDEYASESANAYFGPFVDAIVANPNGKFLDLGCGYRNILYQNCLYLEVYPSASADIVVDPDAPYPIKTSSLDGIGCFAVLEHTRRPWIVVDEIHRMLKPGGKCFIDWPFLQPIHGYPNHYFNATRAGLRHIFESAGFRTDQLHTEPYQTPNWTIHWILSRLAQELPDSLRERLLSSTVAELIEQPPLSTFWSELASALPEDVISELACGNTLIATKL